MCTVAGKTENTEPVPSPPTMMRREINEKEVEGAAAAASTELAPARAAAAAELRASKLQHCSHQQPKEGSVWKLRLCKGR